MKAKELAENFIRDAENFIADTEHRCKPANAGDAAIACLQHAEDVIKVRNAKTAGAQVAAFEEALSMWKSFARIVNTHFGEEVIHEDGLSKYVEHYEPKFFQEYEFFKRLMEQKRRIGR